MSLLTIENLTKAYPGVVANNDVSLEIGRGEKPVAWMEALLLSKNRSLAAATAAADGLYFINALYPPQFQSLLPVTRLSPIWLNLAE